METLDWIVLGGVAIAALWGYNTFVKPVVKIAGETTNAIDAATFPNVNLKILGVPMGSSVQGLSDVPTWLSNWEKSWPSWLTTPIIRI